MLVLSPPPPINRTAQLAEDWEALLLRLSPLVPDLLKSEDAPCAMLACPLAWVPLRAGVLDVPHVAVPPPTADPGPGPAV